MLHELEQSQLISQAEKPKRTIAQNTLNRIEQTYARAKPDSLRVKVLKHYVEYLDAVCAYDAVPDSAPHEVFEEASQRKYNIELFIDQQKGDTAYADRFDKTAKMAEKLTDAYIREGAVSPPDFSVS